MRADLKHESEANPVRRGRRKHAADEDAHIVMERTKADIVAAATKEFVRHGFDGASINEIAAATKTSKRMLYYHFESKRGLYRAVLEAAYDRVGRREPMRISEEGAMDDLRQYAEEAYDNFRENENFVRLVMAENLNNGAVLEESEFILKRSASNLKSLEAIWKRGCIEGTMRGDIRPLDLYLAIVGISFHAVSNRISTGLSLDIDFSDIEEIEFRRKMVGDVACRYVMVIPDKLP